MKHWIWLLGLMFGLSACDTLEENTSKLGHNIKEGYDETRYRLSGYLYRRDQAPPNPDEPNRPGQTGYCYRLAADVVCYDQPDPTLQSRLVVAPSSYQVGGNNYAMIDNSSAAPVDTVVTVDEPMPVATSEVAPAVTNPDSGAPQPLMGGY